MRVSQSVTLQYLLSKLVVTRSVAVAWTFRPNYISIYGNKWRLCILFGNIPVLDTEMLINCYMDW